MMDYKAYYNAYFTKPEPEARYTFKGNFEVTLFYQDYEQAITFYKNVLGEPAYVEGFGTHGWRIGAGWLTLLKGENGNPRNVEVTFEVSTPREAEMLQLAFITAGAVGEAPSDQLMYRPVRYCPLTDPFGVPLLIIAALDGS